MIVKQGLVPVNGFGKYLSRRITGLRSGKVPIPSLA